MSESVVRFALLLMRAVSRLPYPVVRRLGEFAGSLAWVLAVPRRRVARVNLRLCFPHWSEAQRRAVARGHFRYFMRSFFDRFIFWYGAPERIRRLCRLEGIEHFEPHRGRPVIVLAPHFVGLDAGGIRLSLEAQCASMYAAQKSRALTEAMTQGRMRFNNGRLLLRTEGLRPAVKALRDGLPFYFLPDMDLGARDAVFVPFFGVPAATVTSVARLARITGAVVVPLVTTMADDGYVARFYPAWQDFPGDDLAAATRRMNAFIEERVLEMPAQYLWSHKRFKTRPPGEAKPYR
ncbi:MAG TPA: lipid A biosynthesis acyltransferase [Burkholderiaceae bacterium]|jgi:KDO2-lipid IV(A) lauroyltransferase|nr:lipid A biosynthesis acyltransferase [Burkholderiaceae bacterium]